METPKPITPENNSRRIYFTGQFNEDKSEKVVTSLLDLEAKDPLKDILLYISSYGGLVDDFYAMHDALKLLRCKVATIGIGKQMSCGLLLLISGTPGLRFMTKNSRVLIHKLSGGAFGSVSEMEDEVNESLRLQKKVCEMIVDYTNITKSRLEKIMLRQSYFSPQEAKEMGIIDEILESNKNLYGKVNV